MKYIDPKRVTWGGAYSPLPTTNCTMSTSISGTITADRIAEEIDRKLKQIEKERTMPNTCKGETVVDISPGKSAYVKYMDHIIKINNAREFNITHECVGEPLRLELVVDSVETERISPYTFGDVKVYHPAKKPDSEILTHGFKAPQIKKDGRWFDLVPTKVKYDGPATIIFWKDGTKTVVKCQEGDVFDEDVGVVMCYAKKMLGNKGNFNNIFRQAHKVVDRTPVIRKVKASDVLEGGTFYSSALKSMEANINEINDVMKSARDVLNQALERKK